MCRRWSLRDVFESCRCQARAVARVPARMRLLLTATFVPNQLGEFYAIADLANPGRLGTRADFAADFERPLTAARRGPVVRGVPARYVAFDATKHRRA